MEAKWFLVSILSTLTSYMWRAAVSGGIVLASSIFNLSWSTREVDSSFIWPKSNSWGEIFFFLEEESPFCSYFLSILTCQKETKPNSTVKMHAFYLLFSRMLSFPDCKQLSLSNHYHYYIYIHLLTQRSVCLSASMWMPNTHSICCILINSNGNNTLSD